jgi:hypothetical protein
VSTLQSWRTAIHFVMFERKDVYSGVAEPDVDEELFSGRKRHW